MGLFSPKHKVTNTVPVVASPTQSRDLSEPKEPAKNDESADPDDDLPEKKQYAKEKAPIKSGELAAELETGPESETLLNTKLNAMLYHTSEDSIDLYRTENNQSDLMGRLYYDDYDPENRQVVERVTSFTSLQALARGPASPVFNLPSDTDQKKTRRPSFARQVSFDTLSDTHHSAITLKVKHPEFKFRRNNKTFLIGFSNDSESMKAVEWAFLEMVISGDTIIVLQVLDEKANEIIDPSLADIVLEKLKKSNTHSKRISLVYEVVIGNPQKLLKKAILEYKPAMMIVGTRQYGPASHESSSSSVNLAASLSHPQPVRYGTHLQSPLHPPNQPNHHTRHSPIHRSFFQKSSTSKYFLQYALVPVILVKPFYNIIETLDTPIDSENYFRDWLANIDVSHTREKKKKHMFGMRSNSSSRNSSHTSLTDFMHHERGQEKLHEKLTERLQERPHENRGRSPGNTSFSVGESRDSSPSRSRSRTSPVHGNTEVLVDSTSDARSRSRSRSRLSRLFNI